MAYDGMYGDLSTRGTTNEILTQAQIISNTITIQENQVEAMATATANNASLAQGAANTALLNSGLAANSAATANVSAMAADTARVQAQAAAQAAQDGSGITALALATTANTNANTAVTTANTANTNASTALTNANTALSTANTSAATVAGKVSSSQLTDWTFRPRFADMAVRGTIAASNQQGMYFGWNEAGLGEADFVCNQGSGIGGFNWRSVNLSNTVTGPTMRYDYQGNLTVPLAVSANSVSSNTSVSAATVSATGAVSGASVSASGTVSGATGSFNTIAGMTTPLSITQGGTGGNTAAAARTNLGLGTVAIENTVPLSKGGTGRTDSRALFNEVGVITSSALYNSQGMYMGWNASGQGEGHFIVNQGSGVGGFSWRSVNAGNTAGGPTMSYSYAGVLTVPNSVYIAGAALPVVDGGSNLGIASARWAVVYAVTGTINTSDAREKTVVAPFTPDEINAARLLGRELGTYQWLQAVADKGEENARHHIGMTVQRCIEILEANNLDPFRYAFICYDEWPEVPEISVEEVRGNIYNSGDLLYENVLRSEYDKYETFPIFSWVETSRSMVVTQEFKAAGNRYGFRYDQLTLFIARGQEARIAALEAALEA